MLLQRICASKQTVRSGVFFFGTLMKVRQLANWGCSSTLTCLLIRYIAAIEFISSCGTFYNITSPESNISDLYLKFWVVCKAGHLESKTQILTKLIVAHVI